MNIPRLDLGKQPEIFEDYTHSSNSLFHFMTKSDYLFSAIKNKALVPRYCKENIEYLGLTQNNEPFKEMAVLMKCFCDIPLHKITNYSESIRVSESYPEKAYSHISLYGEFALAFSKGWGEEHNIQPITYLNTKASYIYEIRKAIADVISGELLVPDIVIDNYLLQLAFFKPLRGPMSRYYNGDEENITKNFHDEQEWRFIPTSLFQDNIFEPVIASRHVLNSTGRISDSPLNLLSNKVQQHKYKEYWLNFEYNDIRYIIVPDKQSRLDFIDFILGMPDDSFTKAIEKYILISKVLVLQEIRKDW